VRYTRMLSRPWPNDSVSARASAVSWCHECPDDGVTAPAPGPRTAPEEPTVPNPCGIPGGMAACRRGRVGSPLASRDSSFRWGLPAGACRRVVSWAGGVVKIGFGRGLEAGCPRAALANCQA
jgi:hypothetical protein